MYKKLMNVLLEASWYKLQSNGRRMGLEFRTIIITSKLKLTKPYFLFTVFYHCTTVSRTWFKLHFLPVAGLNLFAFYAGWVCDCMWVSLGIKFCTNFLSKKNPTYIFITWFCTKCKLLNTTFTIRLRSYNQILDTLSPKHLTERLNVQLVSLSVCLCVCDWFPDFGSLCVEESTIASLLKLTVVIICLFACLCELEEKSFE